MSLISFQKSGINPVIVPLNNLYHKYLCDRALTSSFYFDVNNHCYAITGILVSFCQHCKYVLWVCGFVSVVPQVSFTSLTSQDINNKILWDCGCGKNRCLTITKLMVWFQLPPLPYVSVSLGKAIRTKLPTALHISVLLLCIKWQCSESRLEISVRVCQYLLWRWWTLNRVRTAWGKKYFSWFFLCVYIFNIITW